MNIQEELRINGYQPVAGCAGTDGMIRQLNAEKKSRLNKKITDRML